MAQSKRSNRGYSSRTTKTYASSGDKGKGRASPSRSYSKSRSVSNYSKPFKSKAANKPSEPTYFSKFDNAYHPASWFAKPAAKPVTRTTTTDKTKPVATRPVVTDKTKSVARAPVVTDKTKGTAAVRPALVTDKTKGTSTASPVSAIVNAARNAIASRGGGNVVRNPTGFSSGSGGGGGGGGIAPPVVRPPVAPPVSRPPTVAPPAPPPPTTVGGNPSNVRSFTATGRPGTFGALQRKRLGRGPMNNLSMTPEMVRRIAARRIGYQ